MQMMAGRCADCGKLLRDGHEEWCVRYRAPRHVKQSAGHSTPEAWPAPHYRPSGGPLPVMLTAEDIKRILDAQRQKKG